MGLMLKQLLYGCFSLLLAIFGLLIKFVFMINSSYTNYITKKSHNRLPPGPSPWPIIGNLPEMLKNKPTFRWILGIMKEMNTDIACFRLPNSIHVVTVNCPKIAQEFLKNQDSIFASRPKTMATEYATGGFLTVALVPLGDQWKKMRKVVASKLLNSKTHQWLHRKRVQEADNLVFYVLNKCKHNSTSVIDEHENISGAVIDVRGAARQYCGNVIRSMIFNKRYFGQGGIDGGPGPEEEEYVKAVFIALSLFYTFCLSDYVPFLRCLDFEGHEKIMTKALTVMNKYHDPIIDKRIQWRRSSTTGEIDDKDPEDLLDILILLKDGNGNPLLSIEEIKAQTTELMFLTIDNPSNAVEWVIAEMINQPEILRKATEEIEMIVGKDRLVQESDLPKLNYVKACAREAFRLHPIAPFNVPHVSTADTVVAGYFIPKGSHVLLSRTGLGRNPKVWDEPLKFKPERHLNGNHDVNLTEPELRFISFSTGTRGCIGVTLGSAMTITLLARLIQGFDWSAPPGVREINLSESTHDQYLAEPLLAYAKPRLPNCPSYNFNTTRK